MTTHELQVLEYLKQNPEAYFNRKEISRRAASREEYDANPHWAAAPLNSLVQQHLVEQNDSGHYRLAAEHR